MSNIPAIMTIWDKGWTKIENFGILASSGALFDPLDTAHKALTQGWRVLVALLGSIEAIYALKLGLRAWCRSWYRQNCLGRGPKSEKIG